MATYAAYRHIELDNVGYGKKRVLKPPGGGSSDIFGGADETSPRRVKNHNASQLGSALYGDSGASTGSSSPETPRANKPGNDSHKRLFGPPEPAPKNTKNHMRSNISLSGNDIIDNINSSNCRTNKNNESNGTHINGTAFFNGNANTNDITDRNPVTGAGYTPDQQNNVTSHNGSSNASINGDSKSTTDSSPSSTNKQPGRGRVPPGGFSSGLW
ncbi:microtubule-associated protein Jupiter isoform X5 [Microplitis mediator]|uniref:microtubule-associated protein Jupiter isoform X5 n=1 Tax=Microplitis mediator TaxID=375433 RepID=UPI002554814F|nr:microtubule-associated protein Jupiter isoform X5 [Microplitis mediator]